MPGLTETPVDDQSVKSGQQRQNGQSGQNGPRTAPKPGDGRHVSLGVQLIAAGLVTSEQVESALAEQRRSGKRLGEILVAHGVLFEDDLARTLAEIMGMAYRDLILEPPDPEVLDYLPEAFCRRRAGCCR